MDYSNVLTALQELEKWRGRKGKIDGRLGAIRERRAALEEELEGVSRELSTLAEALFEPGEVDVDAHLLPPFHLGR